MTNISAAEMEGLLLANLGTPREPDPDAVGEYLREFLSDARVLDMPALLRWMLVNWVIVPRRRHASAAAYRRVWDERGSPLYYHTEDLTRGLGRASGLEDTTVEFAMRYGEPSLGRMLDELVKKGCRSIGLVPLFPQYAEATTGSLLALARDWHRLQDDPPDLFWLSPFYDFPGFIQTQARLARDRGTLDDADLVLFSFHGLPERQLVKSTPELNCLSPHCCENPEALHRRCYRAQCLATAAALAQDLGLDESRWRVTFQSRLGRTRWIEPWTDHVVLRAAEQGAGKLVVFSPSFVCDCLETLDELGQELRKTFLDAGGEAFDLVPCVNADPDWVASLAGHVEDSRAWLPL